jgi:uncharacterized metal-binding protein
MPAGAARFNLDIETTPLRCPVGESYAAEQIREGRFPVLSCEGPCIRGEIAREAAHRVAEHEWFARACQGEAVTVPESGMARWVREAEQVVVLDGCFLRCQARMMRRMLRPDQLVEVDVLALYKKYTDKFAIDEVPEAERRAVAAEVAEQVLTKLTSVGPAMPTEGLPGTARA